jgi:hypothetical protein
MRARDFVFEDDFDLGQDDITDISDGVIEDEADIRGDDNLANALETLRHQAHNKHDVPMVRVDSLINIVRGMPGTEMYSVENLMDAYKSNETVKNLIKDIKDNKDGIKYAYLTTFADDPDTGDDQLATATGMSTDPEKTVNSMANRALSKRG